MSAQRIVIDTTLAGTAISTPVWVEYTTTYVGLFVLVAGAVLLILRLALGWREWKKERTKH